jgi:hypothetical protein
VLLKRLDVGDCVKVFDKFQFPKFPKGVDKRRTDGGPRTADRGRRTADGGPRTADGGRRTADGGRRTAERFINA